MIRSALIVAASASIWLVAGCEAGGGKSPPGARSLTVGMLPKLIGSARKEMVEVRRNQSEPRPVTERGKLDQRFMSFEIAIVVR